jgi:amino acid adenylation domain-containing protein
LKVLEPSTGRWASPGAEWNDIKVKSPLDHSIHQLFEEQAQRTPDAVAVEFAGRRLTYAELNSSANQWAHSLQKRGVQTGTLVGLMIERSLEMVIGLLAILKAGGAYLPLDPANPSERLLTIIEEVRPHLFLTQNRFKDRFTGIECPILSLEQESFRASTESCHNPLSSATAESLAYVMFTSGSTGRPKGVAVPHRGVVRLVKDADYCHLGPDEVMLQFAPLAFDASTFEIWGSLLNGGRLVVFEGQTPSLQELGDFIEDRQVTTLWLTAGLFHAMVEDQLAALQGVRQLLAGGDVLSPSHVVRALRELPGCRLINGYGPTENTTFTCCYQIPSSFDASTSLPIGRAINYTQVYLLDAQGQPVPVGVAGELYIGGAGVAQGYLNRPELTAEKFVPDPFHSQPGARLYRTGDLCRYLPDGNLEFLGRIDHQVKIRGFRIELGEIETVLCQHPQVREAVVLAREDVPGDKQLAAYVAADKALVNGKMLREYLCGKLPDYMVPAAFVLLEALPLSTNGKIDRRALPAPDRSGRDVAGTLVAPRSPLEARLAEIWQEVLGISSVSVDADFFDLGGDSLLATRVISRIRSAFKIDLPLRALFESPTPAGIALALTLKRQMAGGEEPASLPLSSGPGTPLERRLNDEPCPLSFAQQRLWFLDRLVPDSAQYLLPTLMRLHGDLDPNALQLALNAITARHSILRTNFQFDGAEPVQIVHSVQCVEIESLDLSRLPAEEREQEAQAHLHAAACRPLNLAEDSMLRVCLVRMGPAEHLLLLTIHHIASDGWSEDIFFREFSALYTAFCQGKPSPLPPLPFQYGDFAVWQRRWLSGKRLEQQLAYWKTHLHGAPPILALPTDHPRPELPTYAGAVIEHMLPKTLLSELQALSRSHGVTLFMTLLAAFQVVLARYSGQEDIVVGTPIANRTEEQLEGLIGFFVNTLAVRGDLSGDPTFVELLGRVRETALEAYAHQDLPFEKLVEELQPKRSLQHTPLFQVMFILQNNVRSRLDMAGLQATPLSIDTGYSKFDLTLSAIESEAGLQLGVQYAKDLFEGPTIERMLSHFRILLDGILADPQQHISRLPLLTAPERHRLLVEWNDTRADYPRDRCIHQLFEEQVERTPEAVAVVFEEQCLTYTQLNARSNQLAHFLQKQGVGPEVLVGLCIERSLEMIVSLLGILKAGGAYVPLDTTWPLQHLDFILKDSATPILLTQEHLQARFAGQNATILTLESQSCFEEESRENPQSGAVADNRAYVIYTSGSTGRPKGVQICHRAAVNLQRGLRETVLGERSNCSLNATLNASLSFDSSVKQLLLLLDGHCLHIVPEEIRADGLHFARFLSAKRIQYLDCTPAHMQLLVSAGLLHKDAVRPEIVLMGGEAVPEALWQAMASCTDMAVYNVYGPTECTVDTTTARICSSEQVVIIGKPLANTQTFILDAQRQPVPVGVAGELYIGGAGVAQGYLNRPELTAEKFVPDPFHSQPGARLYRTGDLCRYLPDGNLEFLGRIDHQVKIRGFRIELGEIETVLCQHPQVREAVVLAREDVPGDKQLAAYVAADKALVNGKMLREYLCGKLPDYMVPAAFVLLEALPLSTNGKIDRRALPAPDRSGRDVAGTLVAPRSPLEARLAEIWQEVLGISSVSVDADFFDLGGHSLLAIRLLDEIKRVIGEGLSLAEMFRAPTVGQMAGLLQRKQKGADAWSPLVSLQPLGERLPLFCAPVGGGSAFYYRTLAEHIGMEQPLYVFEPLGMNGVDAPHKTIEEMAAYYIRHMRIVQPHGPYRLCGLSFGGLVAYEMARQLKMAGEKIGCLILFDTLAPGHFGTEQPTVQGVPLFLQEAHYHVGFHLENLAVCGALDDKLGYMRSRLKRLKRRLQEHRGNDSWKSSRENPIRLALPEIFQNVLLAERQAREQYCPGSYSGRIILLRARLQQPGLKVDPLMGWDRLGKDIDVIETPGTHFSLLEEPCVHVTLKHVIKALEYIDDLAPAP